VFAEADNYKVLKAAQIVLEEDIAQPILLGNADKIKEIATEFALEIDGCEVIDPRSSKEKVRKEKYAKLLFDKRKRRGISWSEAEKLVSERNYFGAAMVETGEADGMISGLTRNYPATIKPALHMIGVEEGVSKIAGMYIMQTNDGPFFFADTTVNVNPSAQDIADITVLVNRAVKRFKITPKIALLSYSNFGSSEGEDAIKMREAIKILHKNHSSIVVDGEVQANIALNKNLMKELFPFSELANKTTNTLIFPNLSAGNIAYKLMQEMGHAEAIGPILLGMKKPVHVLQIGSSVREIVNMVAITAFEAQKK
jgi:malate dehydrogenase (oxaloacetate-decarboxylating)(NADP+)